MTTLRAARRRSFADSSIRCDAPSMAGHWLLRFFLSSSTLLRVPPHPRFVVGVLLLYGAVVNVQDQETTDADRRTRTLASSTSNFFRASRSISLPLPSRFATPRHDMRYEDTCDATRSRLATVGCAPLLLPEGRGVPYGVEAHKFSDIMVF